ncbi:protein-tyrosine phosphatase, partial [Teratosphaeria nubilosa]
TPTKRTAECPARLRSLIPPPNFGATKSSAVYRSAFPQDRNIEFLKTLNVKTVLCLVATEPSESYNNWIKQGDINRLRVDIAPNKDGKVGTTWDSLCEALLHVLDAANYPLHIHCNQGRHRTGCVIACLRKVQRWPIEDILAEYRSYADPKARPGDIELIEKFDPNCLFDYA